MVFNLVNSPYAKSLPPPLPERRGEFFSYSPCPLREGGWGVRSETPPPAPPGTERGVFQLLPLPSQGRGLGG